MIYIYKELIKNNINRLTISNLEEFAKSKNIDYSDDDLVIIYNFIMNNYIELLNENIRVFETIKNDINPELYKNLLNLYIEYKQKYL